MDFRYSFFTRKNGKVTRAPDGSNGGSDGCVNFEDPDNKGLAECLAEFQVADAYETHCDTVSLADFIVIAAEAAMGRTATSYNPDAEYSNGTLQQALRNQFKSGRTTREQCDNIGLMPNPEEGCDNVNSIFREHIFKFAADGRHKKELTAAIMGAHTIGSAKKDNSGYEGTWTST